ncbi:MAG: PAS domain S-box protein [Spirochaetota bacterium]
MTSGGTIVYTDDDPLNLKIYKKMFSEAGYDIYTAQNSTETYRLIDETQPDILLLDIQLSGESGLDILNEIKHVRGEEFLFVVLITSYHTSTDDQANGLELGADGFITKPIEKRELLARMLAFMRHRKALGSLRRSELRFRTIIDRNPDAILIVDGMGRIRFANPASERMFQISLDELLCRTFGYPVVVGEHTEIGIVHNSKEETVAEMRTIDIEWDDDVSYLTSIRDITRRKRLEDNLRSNQENLRITLDSIADAVIATDENCYIMTMNPVAQRLTGYSLSEAKGKHISEVFRISGSDNDTEAADPIRMACTSGKPISLPGSNRLTSRDGTVYRIQNSAAPIYDSDAVLRGLVIVFRDATEEYRMHKNLQNSEQRYRMLFEQVADGLIVHNRDGRIIDTNQPLCTLFGYTKEEFCRMHLLDIHPDETEVVNTCRKSLEELSETTSCRFQTTFQTKDGEILHGEVTSRLIESGEQNLYLAVFRNVTSHHEAEVQRNNDLKEKKILLRELYHRTKNNMQIISSMLHLKLKTIEDETVKSVLKELNDKVLTMALVHQKLYESNNLSFIRLTDYLMGLIDLIKKSYTLENCDIEITCEGEGKGDDVLVLIDTAVPLGLVTNEIITNSVKYAFPDARKGKIRVLLNVDSDESLRLTISDNGVGLPDDFDPENNSGLGLRTAIDLIQFQLGGTLSIINKNGLSFIMTIPQNRYRTRI